MPFFCSELTRELCLFSFLWDFLVCLIFLIQLHVLGFSVWKAKNSSLGSSSTSVDNQHTKPISEPHVAETVPSPVDETGPGKSFRNFSFNTGSIIQAMESVFSSWIPMVRILEGCCILSLVMMIIESSTCTWIS